MSDAVIDLAQRIRARDEAAANGFSSPANPDQVGRANALSRDLSLPPDLVDRNLSAVEQTAQQIKAREAIRQNPVIGQWAADPRNAMLAKDDTDNLSSIAKLMSGVAGVGEHAARGVAAGVPALTSGLYGVGRMAFEGLAAADRWASGEQGATVLDTAANWMKRQQDAGAAMQARWYGKDPGTFIGSNLKQGLSNVPTQAATLVLSAMGAPEAGAALAGGQQGGQSYKQARDAGKSVGQSALFATTQAASEAVFELAPAKVFAHDTQVGATFGRKVIDFLKSELPNEIATQEYQNLNEWITLNPDKPIKDFLAEQPKSMLATAIQVAVGGTVSAGVAHGSQAIVNTIVNHDRKAQAQADASLLQDIAAGSTESKVRARDPSAFAKFMAMQSDGTPAEHVYWPGEKVAEYFQSQGMDWHDTSHWDFDHSIPGQIDEALATGGDVVMKTSDFAAHLAGTPIWEALKDDARLSPGGLSLNEARALKDQLSSIGDNFEGELQKQELENQPRMMLYQSLRDKLTNAGFTQNAADAQAQLLTARAVTRAARMGQPLTGNEYDHLDVNQALPETLGKVQAADGLDMVIAALKGSGKENSGPSLLDFIAKNGGVEDRGGDIASMGGDKWHREKSFRKKLIKPHDEAQTTFIPGQKHANSLDDMAQRAWEAGYLPEFTERPTTAQFLDVIGQELRGKPRHLPQGANQTAETRQAAQELADILAQEGVDHNKASPKEIRDAVARYQAAREGGLNQSAFHGSPHIFDKFSTDKIGTGEGAQVYGYGLYFAGRKEIAQHYRDALSDPKIDGREMHDNEWLAWDDIRKAGGDIDKAISALEARIAEKTADGSIRTFDGLKAALATMKEWKKNPPNISEPGRLYEVDIPEDDEYLLWDKPLSEQPPKVKAALESVLATRNEAIVRHLSNKTAGQIYKSLNGAGGRNGAPAFMSDKAVSLALHDAGIAGIKYLDGGSRADGDGTHNYVVFDDSRVSIKSYEQSFHDGPRGKISFDQGRAIIDLFQARDQSTFLHETGHMFLEELKADALSPDAPDQLKADWKAVTDWFAANGHKIENGEIPVDAHELWARGFERYLTEGKSPSAGLRKIFDMFRSWLLNIYQVVDNLRSPITPEIREVMDRLVATDEEISQAREQQNIKALFTDAAQAGMTEAEFAAYQKSTTEARDEAFDQLLYKTMQAIRQSRTKAYKEEEANVRGEVTDRVNARPEWRAMEAIKGGQRLDRQALVDKYGEDALRLLPNRVPPVYAEKGVNADELAELSGFRTGDEMVRALMGIGERTRQLREAGDKRSAKQVMIDEETQAVMRERHGDPLNDGSIEEEALAAIHNGKQGEVIASELRQLGKKTGDRPTPYRLAREWAQRKISESKVVEATSGTAIQRYARAAAKAAKAAEEAMLKGDADETFRQKQAQMLNNALIAEAKNTKDRIDIAVARMGRIAKRATMKSVDQAYLDQAHGLLEQVNFRTVSQRQLDRAESFEQWARARQAEGYDIAVPDTFANILGQTHWSRLSIENLFGLDDAVQQIMHLGRLKQKLLDGKDERDYEVARADMLGSIDKLPPSPPVGNLEPGRWDKLKMVALAAHASMTKITRMLYVLDGNSTNGPFNRLIGRPLAYALERQNDLHNEIQASTIASLNAVPDDIKRRFAEHVTIPEMPGYDGATVWSRTQLHQMARNAGTAENWRVLAEGFGWDQQAAFAALDREMTQAEWEYVQRDLDLVGSFWPEIEAMYKRINGIAPPKVEPQQIVTRHGVFPGGYYPLVPDSTKNPKLDRAMQSDDLFNVLFTRAITRNGFTKERTGATYYVSLAPGISQRHMMEVVHDFTHREAVMQADKILSDPRIVEAIRDRLGIEMQKQFRPWLKAIANEFATEKTGAEGMDLIANKMRSSMSMMGMGYRLGTMIKQLAGYGNSIAELGSNGERWFASGMKSVAGMGSREATNFAMEKSGVIRHRMMNVDLTQAQELAKLEGKHGVAADTRRFAFYGIGIMDRVVVIPTWFAGYNKGLAEGMSEEDAVALGDYVVNASQGGAGIMNTSALQRVKGMPSLLVMFYSYGSAYYNAQSQLLRDTGTAIRERKTSDIPRLMARAWWLMLAPNLLSTALGALVGGGPDDDESWAKYLAIGSVAGMFTGIPVVGSWVQSGLTGFDFSASPLDRAGTTIWNAGKDIWHSLDDYIPEGLPGADPYDETHASKRAVRNAVESVGYITSLPLGQPAPAAQFVTDWANGKQDPETLHDWYEGLTTGRIKD